METVFYKNHILQFNATTGSTFVYFNDERPKPFASDVDAFHKEGVQLYNLCWKASSHQRTRRNYKGRSPNAYLGYLFSGNRIHPMAQRPTEISFTITKPSRIMCNSSTSAKPLIEKLVTCGHSDAYIEAVAYGKFHSYYSVRDITKMIAEERAKQNTQITPKN